LVDATFMKANARPRKNPTDSSDPDADHGHKGYYYITRQQADRYDYLYKLGLTPRKRPENAVVR
jgi:hypothetical protein